MYEVYSSGDCSGFAPDSLFKAASWIFIHEAKPPKTGSKVENLICNARINRKERREFRGQNPPTDSHRNVIGNTFRDGESY